jgi:hypothetical protein
MAVPGYARHEKPRQFCRDDKQEFEMNGYEFFYSRIVRVNPSHSPWRRSQNAPAYLHAAAHAAAYLHHAMQARCGVPAPVLAWAGETVITESSHISMPPSIDFIGQSAIGGAPGSCRRRARDCGGIGGRMLIDLAEAIVSTVQIPGLYFQHTGPNIDREKMSRGHAAMFPLTWGVYSAAMRGDSAQEIFAAAIAAVGAEWETASHDEAGDGLNSADQIAAHAAAGTLALPADCQYVAPAPDPAPRRSARRVVQIVDDAPRVLINREVLEKMNACQTGIDRFFRAFPDGIDEPWSDALRDRIRASDVDGDWARDKGLIPRE